jgi:hypothetical protein
LVLSVVSSALVRPGLVLSSVKLTVVVGLVLPATSFWRASTLYTPSLVPSAAGVV